MKSKYANKIVKRFSKNKSIISSPYKNRKIYTEKEAINSLIKAGAMWVEKRDKHRLEIKKGTLGNKNLGRVSFLRNYCNLLIVIH